MSLAHLAAAVDTAQTTRDVWPSGNVMLGFRRASGLTDRGHRAEYRAWHVPGWVLLFHSETQIASHQKHLPPSMDGRSQAASQLAQHLNLSKRKFSKKGPMVFSTGCERNTRWLLYSSCPWINSHHVPHWLPRACPLHLHRASSSIVRLVRQTVLNRTENNGVVSLPMVRVVSLSIPRF